MRAGAAAAFALVLALTPVGAQTPPAPPQTPAPAPRAPEPPAQTCAARLAAAGVRIEPATIAPDTPAACSVADPVRLVAVTSGGRTVTFPDRPVLACGFAETVVRFTRDLIVPLAAGQFGQAVAAVPTGPGHECRPRNRTPGAPMSTHANGIAVDVAGFVLADGRRIAAGAPRDDADRRFLDTVRAAACGWFTTVLGPGSDASHTHHFHFDAIVRGQGRIVRLCQ